MLVSKRREPAAHPKRPARVVFDFLDLIRLHLDTRAGLSFNHSAKKEVGQTGPFEFS
jgi:hypothetical protein